MILASSGIRRLGVEETAAALRFGEEPNRLGSGPGQRVLVLDGNAAFVLSPWCGTCPVLFERLDGPRRTLSIAGLEDRLRRGLSGIDDQVLGAFARLLPDAAYLPLLLRVTPRLVTPGADDDYFAHEQVATWAPPSYWWGPENPGTPYYRTFETPVTADAHLYEFIVPMVPPTWNDRARVHRYTQLLQTSSLPTAVAVSILDTAAPALQNPNSDNHRHWALVHFLLDGHHKLEAAAAAKRPLQLLTLVAVDASLATEADVLRLPDLRTHRREDQLVDTDADAVTLWRPTGPEELALVAASGWREWPPRLPGQPIFYPVLTEAYATKITRDWNVKHSGSGYVTRFHVRRSFLDRYQIHADGWTSPEYWIPAEDLAELNANIVGPIELVAGYHQDTPTAGERPPET